MPLPPLTTLIALGIVLVSSIALAVVGNAYKWDVTARGHTLWVRGIGVVTVLGLAAATAWGRRADPSMVAALAVGGVGLAIAFVAVHVRLTRTVVAALGEHGEGE
ncbi:MAG: hypothetical protein ACYC77_06570 [Coriobacteriia bacterium]